MSGSATSPQVPIVTNHLTHMATPQAARVSPLAMAKMPGLGSIQSNPYMPSQHAGPAYSNPATATQSRPESGGSTTSFRNSGTRASAAALTRAQRKTMNKKKKRDERASLQKSMPKVRNKKAKRAAVTPPPPLPAVIKAEPASPPPFDFASGQSPPSTRTRSAYPLPPDVEIISPRNPAPRPMGYHDGAPVHGQSPNYTSHSSPAGGRVASPIGPYRVVKRSDPDLRRVASLHAAQRPYSPQPREPQMYSRTGPYRVTSSQYPPGQGPYTPQGETTYARPAQTFGTDRSPSPPQRMEARHPYVRQVPSLVSMAPPPPPLHRVVVDQYGNKYYAAEPRGSTVRASVAPTPRAETEIVYERAPSRASVAYAQPAPITYAEDHMPPPPKRRIVSRPEYASSELGYHEYAQPEHSSRPVERVQYSNNMRSTIPPPPDRSDRRAVSHAVYQPDIDVRSERQFSAHPSELLHYAQHASTHIQEAPPAFGAPSHLTYGPITPSGSEPYAPRGYSMRPDMEPPVRYTSRQPSMAPPLQGSYAHPSEHSTQPRRAVSVMPAGEYAPHPGNGVQYNYAQPPVRYVDEGYR